MTTIAFPNSPPVLAVEGLSLSYRHETGWRRVVEDVSFTVGAGEVVALVGESGSGKTTTAQSIIGLLPDNGRVDAGSVRLSGTDIVGWSSRRLDAIRGSSISLVPQDPGSSLNPVLTIGTQVGEILRLHGERDGRLRKTRVIELLTRVGLSEPALRYDQYPHELSGGMKQRVLIAIAVALRPALIIADEPTSALDVTVQRRILDLIDELRSEFGTSVLLVTHDLGVAADRADRIVVLKSGRIQEQGPAASLLARPSSDYTRQLLADAPSLAPVSLRQAPVNGAPSITVSGLVQDFSVAGKPFRAVDDVSFTVAAGTTHALVGESGSGKTTTARSVVGFQRPTAGKITIGGTEISALSGEPLRQFRRNVQLVYQNPFSSLDPRQSVGDIIGEPLRNFEPIGKAERLERVAAILAQVGLPADTQGRSARALSGGQRQRVAIARALILEPRVLVLDEAVSALDVTVQAQILRLLDTLQQQLGLTYLFVTHDLAVVRQIAHTVTVMQAGRAVENGAVAEVFTRPEAAYTRELIAAIPCRRLPRSVRTLEYAGAAE
ncbi:dipeptide ABC transporter ATP-binding protein [Devosia psychrophila]|uniref:ABC transporter ATP-binding protein n=1 Tax=Devosia psychrophila TaxID=728005 RepID=A0A0F5PW53_9HYPH|nr:ABC transporter ATP-binding protein [Devosia psychrophila]KKC32616.1 ABC transporter ATP-binding protein [Devosia psychrophila]SFC50033.1 peptide/nickel transport system ATP-binding protein [Devosia psychrophila]